MNTHRKNNIARNISRVTVVIFSLCLGLSSTMAQTPDAQTVQTPEIVRLTEVTVPLKIENITLSELPAPTIASAQPFPKFKLRLSATNTSMEPLPVAQFVGFIKNRAGKTVGGFGWREKLNLAPSASANLSFDVTNDISEGSTVELRVLDDSVSKSKSSPSQSVAKCTTNNFLANSFEVEAPKVKYLRASFTNAEAEPSSASASQVCCDGSNFCTYWLGVAAGACGCSYPPASCVKTFSCSVGCPCSYSWTCRD